jgi:hypothetical protein
MTYAGKLRRLFFIVFVCAINSLTAQVLVHEEPFHKPVYQNKDVRILNVVIPPGDTSLYHLHYTPSVFVFFTPSAAGTQLQGKGPVSMKFTAGRILFEDLAAPNTRIHRAWNEDKEDMHVMDVELLFENSGFKSSPLQVPGVKLEVDTPWIRGYKVGLSQNEALELKGKKNSFILISLAEANVEVNTTGKPQTETLKRGSFYDIQRKKSFYVKNTGTDNIQFALLELPGQ